MAGTNIYGQMIRAQLQSSATDLTTPVNGLLYYNSVAGSVKWYNGSAWKSAVIDGGTATDLSLSNATTGASSALVQIPQMTTTEKNALVAPVTGRLLFDTTLQSLYVYNGSSWTPAGGGSTLTAIVTQAAHGFVTADIGTPLYIFPGTGVYTKGRADAANTAEIVGVFVSSIDANTFNLGMVGVVSVDTTVSGGAMTVGSVYYLSPTTAGLITATEPTTIGHVSKPVGVAKTSSTMEYFNLRGVVVGGTNALTTIAFANNATSNIQDVGSYQGGELSGYVSISATSSQKFFCKAQFSKNAAGTDFNLSWQHSGETPPASFVMSVTAAGLIQITIGSLAGFTAASITYGLNVAAVGATFPLSISARNVIGDVSGTVVPTGMIGESYNLKTATDISIGTANTSILSQSLGAGTWLINAGATMLSATTNIGFAGIYQGATTNVISAETSAYLNSARAFAGVSHVVTLSATTTIGLISSVNTGSGTALTQRCYLVATRIA